MKKAKLLILISLITSSLISQNPYKILVGTYTQNSTSEGIYLLEFDAKGKHIKHHLLAKNENPSFLAYSPDGQFVYAVNELGEKSLVSAFRHTKTYEKSEFLNNKPIEKLEFINQVPAGGNDPCHLVVTEQHVLTANYSSGSISIFRREESGALSEAIEVVEQPRMHYGNRRFGPSNTHQLQFSPDSSLLISTNLGSDQIFIYRYEPGNKNSVLTLQNSIKTPQGSGPRHITFSKDGKHLYLVRELDAGISVYEVKENAELKLIQETSLISDTSKKNGAADIHISPNGHNLYATNRGENNNITHFRIDKQAKLQQKKQYSTLGEGPRNFHITHDGKYLIVGNQHSNNIILFSICKRNGKLKLRSKNTTVGAPVCLISAHGIR